MKAYTRIKFKTDLASKRSCMRLVERLQAMDNIEYESIFDGKHYVVVVGYNKRADYLEVTNFLKYDLETRVRCESKH